MEDDTKHLILDLLIAPASNPLGFFLCSTFPFLAFMYKINKP